MKSMRLPSAAIFFMTYFHRAGGGAWSPRVPLPDTLLETHHKGIPLAVAGFPGRCS